MNLKQHLDARIAEAMMSAGIETPSAIVKQAQRAEFGQYQSNGIMGAAKKLKTNPRDLAQKVVDQLAGEPDFGVEIAGPGFINITLSNEFLNQTLLKMNESPRLGVEEKETRHFLVDYSSPNLAKEMHIGHLRPTTIGDAAVRILEFLGHKVTRANHVGDWGAQFGSLLAYMDSISEEGVRLSSELKDLEGSSASLTERWQGEKNKLADATRVKEELEQARLELDHALRASEYERAGQLQHQVLPDLEQKLVDAERHEGVAVVTEEVTTEHIASVVSRWTGIPVDKMLEGEREKLLQMEAQIGQRVIGQGEAIAAVSNAVRRSRAGLQDPNRPIGSFLFLGPTGVGKTELTKALAEFLFDDETAMVRIDMSEYMEKHAVARLIGAPPGYVGYEQGGALTEAVRRRPYQVILFDEVEKAHPDVFNVLLQVLDDGRLTDGQGRTVDFRNTLIVMTSNLGSDILAAQTDGAAPEEVRDDVMEIVRTAFRPEFLNRLDEILLFHRLSQGQMGAIVDIQVARLAQRLGDRDIILEVDDAAAERLGRQGYDPVYGARPLKRVIQRHLENIMATMVLNGDVNDGSTVNVSVDGDGLSINGKAISSEAA